MQSGLQRDPVALLGRPGKIAAILYLLLSDWTGERVLFNAAGELCGHFLRKASERSFFKDSLRRMQYVHKPIMRH
jgi:hypothetical protein